MPSMSRIAARSATAVLTAAAATLVAMPAANATPEEDDRAVVHDGNAKSCAEIEVDGSHLDTGDLSLTGGEPNEDQYLTIDSVTDGLTVTAIAIKGGDGYNVYVPGERGLPTEAPWEDLRAPLNGGGNIPQISHRFFCGTSAQPTEQTPTSEPTTTTSTTETSPATETTVTGTEGTTPTMTTTTGARAGEPTSGRETSTTTSVAPVANSDETGALAYTGFSSGWLIWVGTALVLAGAAVLVLFRARGRRE